MSISKLTAALNFFLIVGIVAMAGVAGLVIDTLRIGGPMYNSIIGSKELIADILPPPLNVIEAFQEIAQLDANPREIDKGAERLKALENQYNQRRDFWKKTNYPEEIKRRLTVDSDVEARRFWGEINNEFLPALKRGDRASVRESFDRISSAYWAHRKIVDSIVVSANAVSANVEKAASQATSRFVALVTTVMALVLAFVVFALSVIQSRVTQPLVVLADYMKNNRLGAAGKPVPFLAQNDEIGVVARAVEAFRTNIEERVLAEKNMQLDAALNNIVQGLVMFDADGRLVLFNSRFLEIYGLDEKDLQLGQTLAQTVLHRVESGLLSPDTAEKFVEQVRTGCADAASRQFLCVLNDGRCIEVVVQAIPSGFLVTHEDVTLQRNAEAKIAFFAEHDPLTRLPNRMSVSEQLDKALAYVRRGEMVAVHMIDLDDFKSVNDTLGHSVGDKLLKLVSDRLSSELREQDSVGRMGGDEFAIVERQIAEPTDAVALASRLINLLSEPYEIDGQQVIIGASVGIAVGPQDGCTAEELIRNADLALYRAKADGRGVFRFFEPAMDAQMQARVSLERDLRKAVDNDEFELHFQPIVNVQTNGVSGFEALLRWRHPEKGLVPPDQFIPLAEDTRLIVPIGEWVLREACKEATRWPENLKIAVNLSVMQFHHGNVLKAVSHAVRQSGLNPARLELEITESLLLDGDEHTLNTLHALRGIGAQIIMDDFGTGFSSLSYLQSFPFDKIKIDKSFVKGIDGEGKSLKIVRAVATLANGLGIRTTAEGVETAEQLEAVRAEGCTEIQGYLMSRPMPARDVDGFLRAHAPKAPDKAPETVAA